MQLKFKTFSRKLYTPTVLHRLLQKHTLLNICSQITIISALIPNHLIGGCVRTDAIWSIQTRSHFDQLFQVTVASFESEIDLSNFSLFLLETYVKRILKCAFRNWIETSETHVQYSVCYSVLL